jgi:hypothetical protein
MALTAFDMSAFDRTNGQNQFTGALDGNGKTMVNDPFITGYAFIRWMKLPTWVTKPFPKMADFIEGNFRSLGGLSDIEMQAEGVTSGFNANEYMVPTGISKGNTEFSISLQEWSGQPVRAMLQYWVSGMRDPETGLATYVSDPLVKDGYRAANHTGELLYVVTRPDAHNVNGNNIEFACYWTNVFPTKIPLTHLNYTQGTRAPQEIDVPFKGNFHMSAAIETYAQNVLKKTMFNYKSLGDWTRDGADALRTS